MKKVIVVDDDPQLLGMVASMLKNDYEILEAKGVDEALKACKNNQIDLIITDLFMPDKHGIHLIEQIKETYPDIKVLAISGGNRSRICDFLPLAEMVGANDSLHKPFAMSDLREKVKSLTQ